MTAKRQKSINFLKEEEKRGEPQFSRNTVFGKFSSANAPGSLDGNNRATVRKKFEDPQQ